MSVSALNAAKRLGEKSGWTLTNLELQKLLYLAHMYHLGQYGEPLIHERFEAWSYGPVQPDLYHYAKSFGSSPVKNIFHSVAPIRDDSTFAEMLDKVIEQLSHRSASWLVAVTHWVNGAWANNYKPGVKSTTIPNSEIRREYQDRLDGLREREQANA